MITHCCEQVAPASFVPHLELLAGRVQQAVAAQQLRLGERNVMAEALLAAASGTDDTVMAQVGTVHRHTPGCGSADNTDVVALTCTLLPLPQVHMQSTTPPMLCRHASIAHAQVLEWVLTGVRTDWTSAAFLSSLANPAAFSATYLPGTPDGHGGIEVGGREARWTIYHEVHQIFRVLQRLTIDVQGSPPSPTTPNAGALHSMCMHKYPRTCSSLFVCCCAW